VKAEEYTTQTMELSGVAIRVNSYKIGDRFYCHVENTDPGATVARAEGSTKDEAIQAALSKAGARLK
jgi:hypothetical protein